VTEYELRKELARICRLLYERELVIANAGNVSARAGRGRFLTTPSGTCKGWLEPADFVTVDESGRKVAGSRPPSSEFDMHRVIYEVRPDVQAIVHAHPALATAFTVAGRSLGEPILTEGLLTIGQIATAAYATPGTPAVGNSLRHLVRDHDAILLAHHGAVTCGPDLDTAYWYMEIVEHTAKTRLAAEALGGARSLPPGEVDALLRTRQRLRGGLAAGRPR